MGIPVDKLRSLADDVAKYDVFKYSSNAIRHARPAPDEYVWIRVKGFGPSDDSAEQICVNKAAFCDFIRAEFERKKELLRANGVDVS